LPKAFDENILLGDAIFLLGHMPDAHLQFRLACPPWPSAAHAR
jgi:hypothetical protein